MTLKEFKTAIRGTDLYVFVVWTHDDGDYVRVSHNAFLSAIGGDVPYDRDGLPDGTHVNASVREDGVYVN